jgi:copper transport protein
VVRLLDTRQDEVAGLGEVVTGDGGTVVRVDLPLLEPGTYTVSYQVVSAIDGHITSGRFAFLVDPTGREPPPSGGLESTSPTADPASVAARWLGLAGMLGVVGVALFWLASGLPTLAAAGQGSLGRERVWIVLGLFGLAGFTGLAVYLTLTSAALSTAAAQTGIPFDLAAAFGWTPFAIAMRLALAGSLGAFVVAAARWVMLNGVRQRCRAATDAAPVVARTTDLTGREGPMLALCGALAAVSLLGSSLAGHAAALGGPLNAAVDWLHLLGVAAWIGTLPGLLLFVFVSRDVQSGAGPLRGAVLRRHSRVALLAAPVVVLTGLANAPVVLGPTRELVAAGYGNLLLAKAILLSAALGIGAANFLLGRAGRVRRTAPLVAVELGIGALAVLVGATMVTIPPAVSRVPVLVTPTVGSAHLFGTAGPSAVHLAVSLAAPGPQRYQVAVSDPESGEPQPDVQRVFLVFTPPAASGLAAERVELTPADPAWVYTATGAYTPVVGDWTIQVVVRRAGERDAAATFPLQVREPGPPQRVPPPANGVEAPPILGAAWSLVPSGALGWGLPLALLGGAAALGAWDALRRRHGAKPGSWSGRLRAGLAVAAVLALGVVGSRAVVEAANAAPPAAAAEGNPIAATDESIELGQRLYAANCSSCHGLGGRGDGPLVSRPAPLPPLTSSVPLRSDGQLAWTISTGVAGTEMPGFAGLLSDDDRWHLINYLRFAFGSAE